MTDSTEPATYRMVDHSRWADNIEWFRMPDESGRGRIHGHMRNRPRPGDRIVCPMKSGRDAIFEVQADGNSYPYDPPDQFFVNVAFAGYEDEQPVVEQPVKDSTPLPSCGCPTNAAGDIRCHNCGERVNVRCWKCGTKRGDGPCPSGSRVEVAQS